MKDEEMAEEEYKLAEEVIKPIYRNAIQNDESFAKYGVNCYLAGLKAGRPQWYKVADGDLPTTVGRRFLVSNRFCTMVGYWNGKTFVSADEDTTEIASPIAWCELPKPPEFPKEIE